MLAIDRAEFNDEFNDWFSASRGDGRGAGLGFAPSSVCFAFSGVGSSECPIGATNARLGIGVTFVGTPEPTLGPPHTPQQQHKVAVVHMIALKKDAVATRRAVNSSPGSPGGSTSRGSELAVVSTW